MGNMTHSLNPPVHCATEVVWFTGGKCLYVGDQFIPRTVNNDQPGCVKTRTSTTDNEPLANHSFAAAECLETARARV